MKLTQEDKNYLMDLGETSDTIKQIEACISKTQFYLYEKTSSYRDYMDKITAKEAFEILGREDFLSGMRRTAFHRTALRYVPGTNETKYVEFKSYAFFS